MTQIPDAIKQLCHATNQNPYELGMTCTPNSHKVFWSEIRDELKSLMPATLNKALEMFDEEMDRLGKYIVLDMPSVDFGNSIVKQDPKEFGDMPYKTKLIERTKKDGMTPAVFNVFLFDISNKILFYNIFKCEMYIILPEYITNTEQTTTTVTNNKRFGMTIGPAMVTASQFCGKFGNPDIDVGSVHSSQTTGMLPEEYQMVVDMLVVFLRKFNQQTTTSLRFS